jgi:hypothetical protein
LSLQRTSGSTVLPPGVAAASSAAPHWRPQTRLYMMQQQQQHKQETSVCEVFKINIWHVVCLLSFNRVSDLKAW